MLKLCERAGLVTLGHVALDGTKIKANASKHKAMSYEYMKKREAELQAEIDSWLNAAEAADAAEDKAFGPDNRGDELPDWVADKQTRLSVVRSALSALTMSICPASARTSVYTTLSHLDIGRISEASSRSMAISQSRSR